MDVLLRAIPEACKRVYYCNEELKPSWHPYLRVDHSDAQTRIFRQSLSQLLPFAAASIMLQLASKAALGKQAKEAAHVFIGLIFSFIVYGASGTVILAALTAVVFLCVMALRAVVRSSATPGALRMATALIWFLAAAFIVLGVYCKESRGGFVLQVFPWVRHLTPLDRLSAGEVRWYMAAGMHTLRLVSFGMDALWAEAAPGAADAPSGAPPRPPAALAYDWTQPAVARVQIEGRMYKQRVKTHHEAAVYSNFLMVLGYFFYPPLMLGGPVTTFNAWASHVHKPQSSYSQRQVVIYLLRWAFCFLLLEVGMHYSPLLSFAKHGVPLKDRFVRPQDIIAGSVWQLNYMWLKFLVLWRFHRAWALLEGFETPENMTACVNNNFSLRGFWQGWHRSFNQWLVRYMYVPLGGSRVPIWRQLFNTGVVFGFVAVWHDVKPALLLWGWMFALAFIPELSAAAWANSQHSTARSARDSGWMRVLTAVGGAVNILALIIANFLGYASSQAGVLFLLKAAFVVEGASGSFSPNWATILCSMVMLYTAAQLVALRAAMDSDSSLRLLGSSQPKPKGA